MDMVISKKIIFEIEWQLGRYQQLKQIVEEGKMNIILSSNGNYDNIYSKTGGIYTDETGNKAVKLCDTVMAEEKWIKVIEQTLEFFAGTGVDLFLEKKYFKKKKIDEVMYELHIEKTTYYRWREEAIMYVCMKAIQDGLIRI